MTGAVSILVLLDMALMHLRKLQLQNVVCIVSILVLLDMALMPGVCEESFELL